MWNVIRLRACLKIGDTGCTGRLIFPAVVFFAVLACRFHAIAADRYILRDANFIEQNSDPKCDALKDNSQLLNGILSSLKTLPVVNGDGAWVIGRAGEIKLPHGICPIEKSLDITGVYGTGVNLDFSNLVIVCRTKDTACVDFTGSGQMKISNLSIIGDSKQRPSIGIVVGRSSSEDNVGADHLTLEKVTVTGSFSLASYFNNQSETTYISSGTFINTEQNAYGAIWDGNNSFNVQSSYTHKLFKQYTHKSFNENTCLECIIGTYGVNSTPIFLSNTSRHKFINSYVYLSNGRSKGAKSSAIVLDFAHASTNDFLDLDIHFEDQSGMQALYSLIKFQGSQFITVDGLKLRDSNPFQSGPIFEKTSGVESVGLYGANLEIGNLAINGASWWDVPAAYKASGYIYSQGERFEMPFTFSGMLCKSKICTTINTNP